VRSATVRSRLATVRRPLVRMAATPSSWARAKVAAVKAGRKRGSRGSSWFAIVLIGASGWAMRGRAFTLHDTTPAAPFACPPCQEDSLKRDRSSLGIVATVKLRSCHLWEPSTGKEVRRWQLKDTWRPVALSPDGKVLATAGSDSRIHLYDAETSKEL